MRFGKQIEKIRKEQGLTQEAFGCMFHVTRQTVSNWENEKNYPDLQTLVAISDLFHISLDVLLKGDRNMIHTIDKERRYAASMKREKNVIDFLTGSGTGLVVSCLISPDSVRRTVVVCVGLLMLVIGWYKREKVDKAVITYFEKQEKEI